jgi:hypothetical protein
MMARSPKATTSRAAKKMEAMHTEMAALQKKTHSELKFLWLEALGTEPPKNLSCRLMEHTLAYEIQARAYGRLSKAVRQQLQGMVAPSSARGKVAPIRLTPGTRLMREWRGTVHVVDRTADGFIWNGRTFNSLSAIARTITGVRWNGLAFFGLRKRRPNAQVSGEALADKETIKESKLVSRYQNIPDHRAPAPDASPRQEIAA